MSAHTISWLVTSINLSYRDPFPWRMTQQVHQGPSDIIKRVKTILDDKSLNSETTTTQQEPLDNKFQLTNKPPHKTKTKPVSVSNTNAKQMNTIDNYVNRDSLFTKRTLSYESASPSSVQIAQIIRTDRDGVVS